MKVESMLETEIRIKWKSAQEREREAIYTTCNLIARVLVEQILKKTTETRISGSARCLACTRVLTGNYNELYRITFPSVKNI